MKPTKSSNFQKSFKKKSIPSSDFVFSLMIFFIMLLIISNPSRFSKSTISGLNLFIGSVMPGLFPFMFLTKLLTEIGFAFKISKKCDKFSQKLFGTPGISLYAFLMSILSGYPIGAKIISDLYEKSMISDSDAKKMSVFCTTSGPIFVIGAVGVSMFGEYKIGLILYLSHIISSIMMGIIYNLFTRKNKTEFNQISQIIDSQSCQNIFSNCIGQTISSIFIVGAYITIFYLITEVLETLNIFNFATNIIFIIAKPLKISKQVCQSFVYGLIEVTRGCKNFALDYSPLSVALCSGIISFSGFSIIMQSMAFMKNAKIKMHSFVLTKLVHMILSCFLCFILLLIFM